MTNKHELEFALVKFEDKFHPLFRTTSKSTAWYSIFVCKINGADIAILEQYEFFRLQEDAINYCKKWKELFCKELDRLDFSEAFEIDIPNNEGLKFRLVPIKTNDDRSVYYIQCSGIKGTDDWQSICISSNEINRGDKAAWGYYGDVYEDKEEAIHQCKEWLSIYIDPLEIIKLDI